MRSQILSNDERKAAEAAFQGLPIDLHWSERGQAVYRGIVEQTNGRDIVDAMRNGGEHEYDDQQIALAGTNI
ncbi:MAG TPA: hypothetical protein VJV04_13760 [Nitrospiraceae bacterium]|nr:hypothetical protein [Nitrospiraceae bacterium]